MQNIIMIIITQTAPTEPADRWWS